MDTANISKTVFLKKKKIYFNMGVFIEVVNENLLKILKKKNSGANGLFSL
jgi:hypothetical protein